MSVRETCPRWCRVRHPCHLRYRFPQYRFPEYRFPQYRFPQCRFLEYRVLVCRVGKTGYQNTISKNANLNQDSQSEMGCLGCPLPSFTSISCYHTLLLRSCLLTHSFILGAFPQELDLVPTACLLQWLHRLQRLHRLHGLHRLHRPHRLHRLHRMLTAGGRTVISRPRFG